MPTTPATRPDPATDPRLNGPRRLPLGRPEQLSGLRRRETVRLTADGDASRNLGGRGARPAR